MFAYKRAMLKQAVITESRVYRIAAASTPTLNYSYVSVTY